MLNDAITTVGFALQSYANTCMHEDTNTYTDYNDDVISVYKVQEMTQKEADVLIKMGVLY